MRRLSWISLLLVVGLWADTGGLESLPATVNNANMLSAANLGFESGHSWTGMSDDAVEYRSGAQSYKTALTEDIAYLTVQPPRLFSVEFWIITDGDPGASASAEVYWEYEGYAGPCGGAHMSLSGGLGDWTQFTGYCYGITNHWHAKNQTLRIIIENNTNTVQVNIDDVELTPITQPLIIFPLYPNYRGMVWDDQGETLTWKALVELPDGYSVGDLYVRVQIVRVSDSNVMDTVTDNTLAAVNTDYGNNSYRGSYWPDFSENDMEYDSSGLADTAYYLRGTLREIAGDGLVYTYPDYRFVKEAASAQRDNWKVWIDKYNRTILNDEPAFIYGSYFIPNAWYTQQQNGAADCCTVAGRVTDNHRKIAIGCRGRRLFYITDITRANPGVVTVNSPHNIDGNHRMIFAGGTGDWAAFDGNRYINTPVGSNVTSSVDTSGYSEPYPGGMTMIRERCYSDDQALPRWNRAFGLTGATFIKMLGHFGMNMTIRYGNYANPNSGVDPLACATYNSDHDWIRPWLTALQDVGAWHLQINNNWWRQASGTQPCRTGWDVESCSNGTTADCIQTFMDAGDDTLGDEDGFAGFYVADEPNDFGTAGGGTDTQDPPDVFLKAKAYRDDDSGGVNYWLDFGGCNIFNSAVANAPDVFGSDPYPVGAGVLPDDASYGVTGSPRHGRSYWWPRSIGGYTFDSRPRWTLLQLFRQLGSWPSLADMKIQAISALASGTQGILWWQMGGADGLAESTVEQDPTYYDDFAHTAKFIADLMPLLSEPIEDLADRWDGESEYGTLIASVSNVQVVCSSREKDSVILLACANTDDADAAGVTITLTAAAMPSTTGTALLPWDGSEIAISARAFSDDFESLLDGSTPEDSVHLYLIETQEAAGRTRPAR